MNSRHSSIQEVSLESPDKDFDDLFDVIPDKTQCLSPISPTQFNRSEGNDIPIKFRKSPKKSSCSSGKMKQKGRKLRKSISLIDKSDCMISLNTVISKKQSSDKSLQQCVLPRSPYFLVHELLYHNPWKLLVATILIENTSAHQKVVPVIWKVLNHWPTPELASEADLNQLANFIFPIGHNYQKAEAIINFSNDFLTKKWTYPIELQGIGPYGNDSYRIFCMKEWLQVEPTDEKLKRYCRWLKSNSERFGLTPTK